MGDNTPLFALGQVVITPAALEAMRAAAVDPDIYINRHRFGDWGEVEANVAEENEQAAGRSVGRIRSAYLLPDDTRIGVITSVDRSTTTLLLQPDD